MAKGGDGSLHVASERSAQEHARRERSEPNVCVYMPHDKKRASEVV